MTIQKNKKIEIKTKKDDTEVFIRERIIYIVFLAQVQLLLYLLNNEKKEVNINQIDLTLVNMFLLSIGWSLHLKALKNIIFRVAGYQIHHKTYEKGKSYLSCSKHG